MHKSRTFPIRESSEAWGGNAEGNARKREKGKGRSPDEDIQSTARTSRVCNAEELKTFQRLLMCTSQSFFPIDVSYAGIQFLYQRKCENHLHRFSNSISMQIIGLWKGQNLIKRWVEPHLFKLGKQAWYVCLISLGVLTRKLHGWHVSSQLGVLTRKLHFSFSFCVFSGEGERNAV